MKYSCCNVISKSIICDWQQSGVCELSAAASNTTQEGLDSAETKDCKKLDYESKHLWDWDNRDNRKKKTKQTRLQSCSPGPAPPKQTKTASQLQWICFIFLLQKQTKQKKLPSRNTGIQEIMMGVFAVECLVVNSQLDNNNNNNNKIKMS